MVIKMWSDTLLVKINTHKKTMVFVYLCSLTVHERLISLFKKEV